MHALLTGPIFYLSLGVCIIGMIVRFQNERKKAKLLDGLNYVIGNLSAIREDIKTEVDYVPDIINLLAHNSITLSKLIRELSYTKI